MKPILSYTTLSNLHISPHSYINKMMGIETPENEYMTKGKSVHQIIQDHFSGKKIDPRLSNWNFKFNKVEYHCRKEYGNYLLHGFLDAANFATKEFLEIKSSSKPWSQSQFYNLIQAPYYALVSGLKKVVFLTCDFDLKNIKIFTQEFSDRDLHKAQGWADEAIKIIESGEFRSDLDATAHCDNPRCPYGSNCWFR